MEVSTTVNIVAATTSQVIEHVILKQFMHLNQQALIMIFVPKEKKNIVLSYSLSNLPIFGLRKSI